jgi:hypothetical protein
MVMRPGANTVHFIYQDCGDQKPVCGISENLHRAELTALERAEQITEYAGLAKEKREADKAAQLGPVSGGRGNTGGARQAARDLGLTRQEVQRAERNAAFTPAGLFARPPATTAQPTRARLTMRFWCESVNTATDGNRDEREAFAAIGELGWSYRSGLSSLTSSDVE